MPEINTKLVEARKKKYDEFLLSQYQKGLLSSAQVEYLRRNGLIEENLNISKKYETDVIYQHKRTLVKLEQGEEEIIIF